jgi:lipopolysaccharide-induced tumor necrosis factor-alpha factor
MRFNETPVSMKCQFCHADIVTSTEYVTGLLTWIVAGICCVFG